MYVIIAREKSGKAASMNTKVFVPTYEKFYKEKKPRLLSAACYFGLSPILCAAGVNNQKNRYLSYHVQYSLMLSLLLFWFVVTFALTIILLYLTGSMDEGNALMWLARIVDTINTGLLLVCLIAWGYGLYSALAGRVPYFPVLSGIAAHKGWMKFSLYWTAFVQACFTLLVLIALHGAILARPGSAPPQAYILYTQGGYIPLPQWYESYTPPHWTMSLFFYPIVLASNRHWGSGSVAIQPLSDSSFREAIHNGRFVFVASHGGMEPGSFTSSYIPYKSFLPSDVMPGDTGSQLRYVYFAACDAGLLGDDWEKALSPAQVRTFDRISYVHEHFLWVWTKGAKVVHGIE